MSREWWMLVVQWAFWGLVMAVVMGWVARSRLKQRPESDQNTLQHPKITLAIGIVAVAFFIGIAIFSYTVGRNSTSSILTALLFLGFGLGSATLIADYLFARHQVSDSGIEYGRMLGQRGFLPWSEVRKLRYAQVMKWFVLETASGARVRVSAYLIGLPEFAHFALRGVPAEAIDPDTRLILEETEQGQPPNVWG